MIKSRKKPKHPYKVINDTASSLDPLMKVETPAFLHFPPLEALDHDEDKGELMH